MEVYTNGCRLAVVLNQGFVMDTPVAVEQSFSGNFAREHAIGGETTGTILKTDDGEVIELDIETNDFGFAFQNGAPINVKGFYKEVMGVETGPRQVLVVESLTSQPF